MVNREEYAKAKRLLKDIHHELATQPLTQAQREELQDQAAGLATFFPVLGCPYRG